MENLVCYCVKFMLKKSNQPKTTGFSLQDIYMTIWEEIQTSKGHHSYSIIKLLGSCGNK
jgi:hypothetical protein